MWNKDEVRGKGKQISGAIKDKVGELIKDPKLEAKGEAQAIGRQSSGEDRETWGRLNELGGTLTLLNEVPVLRRVGEQQTD